MAVCNYILECKKSRHEISGYGLGLISAPDILASHFGTDIPSRGLFGTRIFRHKNISAWVFFGTMDVSAWGHYNTGTFRHNVILALGPMPKRQSVHGFEIYPCQNVVMLKYPHAKKSTWWNIHAEMPLAEMSGAQITQSRDKALTRKTMKK